MQHLDDGGLRRLLDDPFSVPPRVREHVEACTACGRRRDAIAADAEFAAARLAGDTLAPPDIEAAYGRLRASIPSCAPSTTGRIADVFGIGGRRVVLTVAAGLAAVAATLLLAFTPVGTLAQNFLTIFEPRQFVAVPVTKAEMQYLPDLESFGTIVQHVKPENRDVTSPAQAAVLTGLPVRIPSWLPAGLPRPVHYVAISRGVASFTFSAQKARAFAAASHRPMPAMPPGLDGSTLTLQVGPMVIVGYGPMPASMQSEARRSSSDDDDRSMPALIVVQSASPQLTSTGATAREIEGYLLAMPGVAPQLADEIRAIGDPGTTMPVPVPVDKAFAQNVSIDGVTGLGIGDETGVGGMIMWQKNGIVYGVGGTMPQHELMEVASSLR